jgi:2-oxoglutarate dehydrogenase complex dehydrogenase (E1) component-like enzyme
VDTPGKLAGYLRDLHCGTVGFDFFHLDNREERDWLLKRWDCRAGAGRPKGIP